VAWYWPQIDSSDRAKAAVVNAIGCSVLLALMIGAQGFGLSLSLPQRSGRVSAPMLVAAAVFALIAWGIRRMSRIAAVTGASVWFLWLGFTFPRMLSIVLRSGDGFSLTWPFLYVLFLYFYFTALRATFSYHRLHGTASR
jgi:hypothetical protein